MPLGSENLAVSLDLFATIPTLNESRLNTLAPTQPFRGIAHLAPGRTAGRGEGSFDVKPYLGLLERLTGVDLLQEEVEGVTRVPREERSTTVAFRTRRVPAPKVAEIAARLAEAFEQSPERPPTEGPETAEPLRSEEWRDLVRFFQVCADHRYAVTLLLE